MSASSVLRLSSFAACFSLAAVFNAVSSAGAGEPPLPLKIHQAPKALPAGAVTADWPRFLGPSDNCTSPETKLLHSWLVAGPALVWEMEKGEGHTSPVIAEGRLVLFHRVENRERLDCLEPETGRPCWSFAYAAPFQNPMGTGNGPPASAIISAGRVFTYGVTGQLHAFELATGAVLWSHDCDAEFALVEAYFGHGATPLVLGSRVIVQLGGAGNVCAAAFDAASGKLLWKAIHPWPAGYASPVAARLHDRECVLLFAGGKSRPPTGGLLCLDAATGEVLNATPRRARIAESVNASSPVVVGDRVFISEAYGSGGAMIEITPDFQARPVWQTKFGAHFMTPVVLGNLLIGSDGQSPRLAELACLDVGTGRELWRDDLGGKFGRTSLLAADGACLCLGEGGDLAWLEATAAGVKITQQTQLFHAPETWTLPSLSHGLLYVSQNDRAEDGSPARLLCYDLRAEK